MFLYNLSEFAHISIPSMKFIKISYYKIEPQFILMPVL